MYVAGHFDEVSRGQTIYHEISAGKRDQLPTKKAVSSSNHSSYFIMKLAKYQLLFVHKRTAEFECVHLQTGKF